MRLSRQELAEDLDFLAEPDQTDHYEGLEALTEPLLASDPPPDQIEGLLLGLEPPSRRFRRRRRRLT